MSVTPAISVKGLSFSYGEDLVLDNVTFEVNKQKLCALVGPNGAGKSTLIKCLTGLMPHFSGNANISCEHSHKSHRIGYVPQRLSLSGKVPLSVFETVGAGMIIGKKRWFRFSKQDRHAIEHAIESVGLTSHAKCRFDTLSGGQQQRVLIAKAIVSDPEVLILDEPTAGIDSLSQRFFRDAIYHAIKEHSTTVLLVSHDLSAVADIVDQIIVLKNKVLFNGTPQELNVRGVQIGLHEHDLPFWLERIKSDSLDGEIG